MSTTIDKTPVMDRIFDSWRHIAMFLIVIFVALGTLFLYSGLEKKQTIKEVHEMVEDGELTEAQGDAIIWVLYEYKPKKHKK